MSPAHLIAEGTELERLWTGAIFTEGPLWSPDGYLLFSDMPDDCRRRWDPENGTVEVARPSNKGNGLTWDLEGRLLICEHSTSSVVRIEPDGGRTVLASHHGDNELNSPNDVVVKSDGSIYFTDPDYGRLPVFGIERENDLDFCGVYRIPPGGGDVELLVADFDKPNGLCFSADEKLLYICDTSRMHVRVFDVQADGSLANGRVFAVEEGSGADGAPDGMKLDVLGNLYCTGPGGVWIWNSAGEKIGLIATPENPANLNWGGAGWNELYICASTSVYRLRMQVAGHPLPYML